MLQYIGTYTPSKFSSFKFYILKFHAKHEICTNYEIFLLHSICFTDLSSDRSRLPRVTWSRSIHQNMNTRLQVTLLWFICCNSIDTIGGKWHRGKSFELIMNLEKWHCHDDMSVLHRCVITTLKTQSNDSLTDSSTCAKHYTQNTVNLIVSLTPQHVQRGSGVLSNIVIIRKGLMKLRISCRY